jgi:hypothetical protein
MTPEQFCYWMQGFVEITSGEMPTPGQWKSIGEHLQQVFNKKTPPVGPATTTPAIPPQVNPFEIDPHIYRSAPRWPDDKLIC